MRIKINKTQASIFSASTPFWIIYIFVVFHGTFCYGLKEQQCPVCFSIVNKLIESLPEKSVKQESIINKFVDVCRSTEQYGERKFCQYFTGQDVSVTELFIYMSERINWGFPVFKICGHMASRNPEFCILHLTNEKDDPTIAIDEENNPKNILREYRAIMRLHSAMDDDDDGMVDVNESKDFLTKDLSYSQNSASSARHKAFHARGTDDQIDVNELWNLWSQSLVRNWTTDKMVEWLMDEVTDNSDYVDIFRSHNINGSHLPQMAAESGYLSSLNISTYLHKIKLKTKAKDVVLFGPPQRNGYLNGFILFTGFFTILCLLAGLLYMAISQRKRAREYQENYEAIKKVERELTEALEQVSEEKKSLNSRKSDLEQQLQRQYSGSNISIDGTSSSCINLTQNDQNDTIEKLKSEVSRLEQALRLKKWVPDRAVKSLLIESYRRESWLLDRWRNAIQEQAAKARMAAGRLEKKSTTVWGIYKSALNTPAEESRQLILDAKEATLALHAKLHDRDMCWKQIQEECNFSVREQT